MVNKQLIYQDNTLLEKEIIDILLTVLETSNIPASYYNISGYADDAACIVKDRDKWKVFDGERGKKNNVSFYTNIVNACFDLISRVSDDMNEEEQIRREFIGLLLNRKEEGNVTNIEIQIINLTARINELTEHFRANPKEHYSRRGLLKMVGQRRGLLAYLKKIDIEKYKELIEIIGKN